jgi:hypothetical protein
MQLDAPYLEIGERPQVPARAAWPCATVVGVIQQEISHHWFRRTADLPAGVEREA